MDELLIAFAILITPCDPTETYQDFDTPIVRMAMNQWSVELELIDKNVNVFHESLSTDESGNTFIYIFDGIDWVLLTDRSFDSSVQFLQTIKKTVENYPKTFELGLFPNRNFVENALSCNLAHRNLIDNLKAINSYWHSDVLKDTDQELIVLNRIWSFLLHNNQQSVVYRRLLLNELRNVIGEENYYSGRMPPPIPVWRFPVNE